jgi:hypothetical protein
MPGERSLWHNTATRIRLAEGGHMKALGILIFAIAASAPAQQEWTPGTHLDGGVSQVLQSIYIPPLHNAPFTATVHTEWARPMAGGSSTVMNQRKVARDRDGRIYEERWLLVPKNGNYKSEMNVIQIYDPNAHTGYDCFLMGRKHNTCVLDTYFPVERPEGVMKTGPLPRGMGIVTHEDLGIRDIEGVETVGTRDTTTVKAGAMGNDQPMTFVREYWRSTRLGVNLISIVSDPRIGTQTFKLSDISVTEVDPKYFQLPDGFAIDDQRKEKSAVPDVN